MLDCKTFSHLIQCRTGHAHIGDYYQQFIPSETQNCACGATIQTRFHVLKECRRNSKHRHLLGQGRHSQVGRLMGTIKGIWKLAVFIRRSKAMEKQPKEDTERVRDMDWREGNEEVTTMLEMANSVG